MWFSKLETQILRTGVSWAKRVMVDVMVMSMKDSSDE